MRDQLFFATIILVGFIVMDMYLREKFSYQRPNKAIFRRGNLAKLNEFFIERYLICRYLPLIFGSISLTAMTLQREWNYYIFYMMLAIVSFLIYTAIVVISIFSIKR